MYQTVPRHCHTARCHRPARVFRCLPVPGCVQFVRSALGLLLSSWPLRPHARRPFHLAWQGGSARFHQSCDMTRTGPSPPTRPWHWLARVTLCGAGPGTGACRAASPLPAHLQTWPSVLWLQDCPGDTTGPACLPGHSALAQAHGVRVTSRSQAGAWPGVERRPCRRGKARSRRLELSGSEVGLLEASPLVATWCTVGRVWRAGTGHSELPPSWEERQTHRNWERDVPGVKVLGAGGCSPCGDVVAFYAFGSGGGPEAGFPETRGSGVSGAGSTGRG